jgi:hypothetical protein
MQGTDTIGRYLIFLENARPFSGRHLTVSRALSPVSLLRLIAAG